MTSLRTTMTATWPTTLTPEQQTALGATIASAISDGTVTYTWRANVVTAPHMLPAVDTPGPSDEAITCPVCQAEFRAGSKPL